MRTEDKILKILKQHTNGIMAEELYEELSTPIPKEEMHSACAFLKKYGLITVGYRGESAKITERGRQLLNLPDLPDDELPSDQLEVLERHWGDEMDRVLDQEADLNLKDESQQNERRVFMEAVIQTIRLLGNAAAMGGFMVMFVTFMMVYFGKWGGIDINYYGEANFEFVMLFILLPVVIYVFIYNINNISRKESL